MNIPKQIDALRNLCLWESSAVKCDVYQGDASDIVPRIANEQVVVLVMSCGSLANPLVSGRSLDWHRFIDGNQLERRFVKVPLDGATSDMEGTLTGNHLWSAFATPVLTARTPFGVAPTCI